MHSDWGDVANRVSDELILAGRFASVRVWENHGERGGKSLEFQKNNGILIRNMLRLSHTILGLEVFLWL